MICVQLTTEDGRPILVTEISRFLRCVLIRKFICVRMLCDESWVWAEFPTMVITDANVMSKLNYWLLDHFNGTVFRDDLLSVQIRKITEERSW